MKSASESSASVQKTRNIPAAKPVGKARKAEVSSVEVSSANGDFPREQMIAEAAYYRAEQRGFTPGNEMTDWLEAEADMESVRRNPQ